MVRGVFWGFLGRFGGPSPSVDGDCVNNLMNGVRGRGVQTQFSCSLICWPVFVYLFTFFSELFKKLTNFGSYSTLKGLCW